MTGERGSRLEARQDRATLTCLILPDPLQPDPGLPILPCEVANGNDLGQRGFRRAHARPPPDQWERGSDAARVARGGAPVNAGAHRCWCAPPVRTLLGLELQVLVGRRESVTGDEPEPRLFHAPAPARDEGELVDRRGHCALVDELLDALQDRLALRTIELGGLLLEETVQIGVAAVRERAIRDDAGLEAGGAGHPHPTAGSEPGLEPYLLPTPLFAL